MKSEINMAAADTETVEIATPFGMDKIDGVRVHFEDYCARHGISQVVLAKFQIALDELLTNIVSYRPAESAKSGARILMECSHSFLRVTVIDKGPPFNPLERAVPDTTLDVEQRKIGGLGIHLIRNLIDDVSYERRDDSNVLIMTHHRVR